MSVKRLTKTTRRIWRSVSASYKTWCGQSSQISNETRKISKIKTTKTPRFTSNSQRPTRSCRRSTSVSKRETRTGLTRFTQWMTLKRKRWLKRLWELIKSFTSSNCLFHGSAPPTKYLLSLSPRSLRLPLMAQATTKLLLKATAWFSKILQSWTVTETKDINLVPKSTTKVKSLAVSRTMKPRTSIRR